MGALIFARADNNAVHEIEGLLCLLIGTVGLGFATLIASTERVRDEVEVQTRTVTGQPRAPQRPPG
jgi:hypothetical protein